jgi:tetratricopeptide (TPR) repeat protein
MAWSPLDYAVDCHHALGEYPEELHWANIALERFPDVGNFYVAKARALSALQRADSVSEVIEKCSRERLRVVPYLSSLNTEQVMFTVALELRLHGHPRESGELLSKVLSRLERRLTPVPSRDPDPNDLVLYAAALRADGRWAEAREPLLELDRRDRDADRRDWDADDVAGALGVIAAHTGDLEGAQRAIDELMAAAPRQSYFWRACIAAHLGREDRAVELLREGFSQGLRFSLKFHHNVDLEPLWDYPPYQDLIAPKG